MDDNEKQVALVTGGSRGIGRAIALALAKSGRHVIVNYRSQQKSALEVAKSIEAEGGTAEICAFDVADGEATATAIEQLYEKHPRIDILVNNAGITRDTLLVFMKTEEWQQVIDTNLTGFFNVTRPVSKKMLLKRTGRIVNISSTAGQTGQAGQVNYSASKAGLIGASKALAREIAKRNITVNVVAPGFTETDMLEGLPIDEIKKTIPMQRIGEPDDVAALVVFLCSSEAGYITGQVIGVNGGIC
ncbi:MAG: 3-oxoacyl-ACP reductase FabG [Candidatus Hydrogenedentota bacterium]